MLKPTPTSNINKPAKGSLGKSTSAKKKEKRRKKWQNVWADTKIYAFCIVGVVGKHAVNVSEEVIDFSGLTIPFMGFALVAAFITVAVMESEGSLEGKKRNFKRRAFIAFLAGLSSQAILQDVFG